MQNRLRFIRSSLLLELDSVQSFGFTSTIDLVKIRMDLWIMSILSHLPVDCMVIDHESFF
jgi:hypothetical protein